MADANNVCGLCGARNSSDAVVCVQCGALLAAYRSAAEPAAAVEMPVTPSTAEADEQAVAPAAPEPVPATPVSPVIPGSASASIFGETKVVATRIPAPAPIVTKPVPVAVTAPAAPPISSSPSPASALTPEQAKARRLRRLADERIEALEAEAKEPRSSFQPTFQQLKRKSAPARRSFLEAVARQPKQVGVISALLFVLAMGMLGSGSLLAETIGLFVLIAAVIAGATALLEAARDYFDSHGPR